MCYQYVFVRTCVLICWLCLICYDYVCFCMCCLYMLICTCVDWWYKLPVVCCWSVCVCVCVYWLVFINVVFVYMIMWYVCDGIVCCASGRWFVFEIHFCSGFLCCCMQCLIIYVKCVNVCVGVCLAGVVIICLHYECVCIVLKIVNVMVGVCIYMHICVSRLLCAYMCCVVHV